MYGDRVSDKDTWAWTQYTLKANYKRSLNDFVEAKWLRVSFFPEEKAATSKAAGGSGQQKTVKFTTACRRGMEKRAVDVYLSTRQITVFSPSSPPPLQAFTAHRRE